MALLQNARVRRAGVDQNSNSLFPAQKAGKLRASIFTDENLRKLKEMVEKENSLEDLSPVQESLDDSVSGEGEVRPNNQSSDESSLIESPNDSVKKEKKKLTDSSNRKSPGKSFNFNANSSEQEKNYEILERL
jgi:hypothetical protein